MGRQPLARACALFLETPSAPLTDEQFILFHSSDRELYARLALSLRREPAMSMKVVAFWMLLERATHDTRLIRRILFLPPTELNKLADETVTCLECVEGENGFSLGTDPEISLLPNLLSSWFRMMFRLRSLHMRRAEILDGVNRIIDTICVRAFKDIMQQILDENAAMQEAMEAEMGGGTSLKEGGDIQGSRT